MAAAAPSYEEMTKVLDEESGILYTSVVQLWPDLTETTNAFYNGDIYLDSLHAKSAVTYKLRVSSKQKHKRMFRSRQGEGCLEPNGYHKIGIQVREEAIVCSQLHLHLNGRRLVLTMEKSAAGEHFYRQIQQEAEQEKQAAAEERCEEGEILSPWQRTDQQLAKIMPTIVQHYIKQEQRYNLHRAVFQTVYPLILEMMGAVADRGRSSSAQQEAFYYEALEQPTDVIGRICDYVLLKLEEQHQLEEEVGVRQKAVDLA